MKQDRRKSERRIEIAPDVYHVGRRISPQIDRRMVINLSPKTECRVSVKDRRK